MSPLERVGQTNTTNGAGIMNPHADFHTPYSHVPDARGRFGPYGGRYVPETLVAALDQLDQAYREAKEDKAFQTEFRRLLVDYVGRPSRLYYADRLTQHAGGARIYLKREDLNHTGAHKINNA